MQPQPDPIVNAHRSVGSGPPEQHEHPSLPFRMKHRRASHGYQCDAARCEDEATVHYGANTSLGWTYTRDSTRLCDRHLKLYYRWKEVT